MQTLCGTGQILDGDGNCIATPTGDITAVIAGTGLIGGATSGAATLNVDTGITANKIVQLDGSARLPAVDGSLLTNIAADDVWTISGGDIFRATGNVGIGTSSPDSQLHILAPVPRVNLELSAAGTTIMDFKDQFSANQGRIIYNSISDQFAIVNFNPSPIPDAVIVLNTEGNVGIGKSFPLTKLDVGGGLKVDGTLFNVVAATNRVGINTVTPGAGLDVASGGLKVDGTTFNVDQVNNRVGIGTATPAQALDVVGNASIDGSTLFVDATNNRVGIGTASPTEALEVAGKILGTPIVGTWFPDSSTPDNTFAPRVIFDIGSANTDYYSFTAGDNRIKILKPGTYYVVANVESESMVSGDVYRWSLTSFSNIFDIILCEVNGVSSGATEHNSCSKIISWAQFNVDQNDGIGLRDSDSTSSIHGDSGGTRTFIQIYRLN